MRSNNHNRTNDGQQDASDRNYRDNRADTYAGHYNAYGREYNSGQRQDENRERSNYQSRSDADNNYQNRSPYENRNSSSSRYNNQTDDYQTRDSREVNNAHDSRNTYGRNDFDRYKNYEGNSGRGNYQDNDASSRYTGSDNYTRNQTSYSERPIRDWDSKASGYYNGASGYPRENERNSPYGVVQGRDDRDWNQRRSQSSSYTPERNQDRYEDDRNLFSRMGDSIKNTWHHLTDRDDTEENTRRFNQRDRSDYPQSNYSKGQERPFYSPDNYNTRYTREDGRMNRRGYDDASRDRGRYGNGSY